ncbi:MAG: acetylornithine deacetylase [Sphingomonadales bacterium]
MAGESFTPLEMLEQLVRFDTTSRNSNLALIDFVVDYLAGHGVAAEIYRDPAQPKANLFATIGPADRGGVILSGHTDVVPVDGQDWSRDPFVLTKDSGRFYGRGTADMKGFLATALALTPEFKSAPLRRPIHLALSYDEELGCSGVHSLIAALSNRAPRPEICIVGEPTEMKIVTGHKGIRTYETEITGREAHSSAPDMGASAISAAAELIGFLGRLATEFDRKREAHSRFALPYSTINVGVIEGGNAINIIAGHCRFSWECRPLPGWDEDEVIRRFEAFAQDELLPRLRATAPDARIEIRETARVPVYRGQRDSGAETLMRALTGRNRTDVVAFGTEAGLFEGIGIPTVVCGPGSIGQAHKPDEFIEQEQIETCLDFLRRLKHRLCQD